MKRESCSVNKMFAPKSDSSTSQIPIRRQVELKILICSSFFQSLPTFDCRFMLLRRNFKVAEKVKKTKRFKCSLGNMILKYFIEIFLIFLEQIFNVRFQTIFITSVLRFIDAVIQFQLFWHFFKRFSFLFSQDTLLARKYLKSKCHLFNQKLTNLSRARGLKAPMLRKYTRLTRFKLSL